MAAMVTNASRLVHNGLIGATIVASGVYRVGQKKCDDFQQL